MRLNAFLTPEDRDLLDAARRLREADQDDAEAWAEQRRLNKCDGSWMRWIEARGVRTKAEKAVLDAARNCT